MLCLSISYNFFSKEKWKFNSTLSFLFKLTMGVIHNWTDEIHEVNTKEFNMKVEQLNFKFKDVTTTHEIEYASLANRLTVMEKSLEAMQAE